METRKRRHHMMLVAAFVALLAALPVFAADGDKSNVKGLITAVQGDTITIKDANNAEQTITVTPNTVYYRTKGLTGAMRDRAEQGAMIPGLPISADVVAHGQGFEATQINFKADDFKTAQQVQAGLSPTHERMNKFGTYEALETVEVHFASGSTKLDDRGKADLMAFSQKAKDTQNYQVVLQGFTDSTGNAAANQRLSRMRGEAVANFLQQQGGLMPGRVRAPDGMGVATDAGSGSNAGARKVVVKLVVDKGVQAGP